jgi:hypothetical protein
MTGAQRLPGLSAGADRPSLTGSRRDGDRYATAEETEMPDDDTSRPNTDARQQQSPARSRKRDVLELLDDRSRKVLAMIARRWVVWRNPRRPRNRPPDD